MTDSTDSTEHADDPRNGMSSSTAHAGATTTGAPEVASPFPKLSPLGRVGYIAKRAWQMEVGVWVSLYRAILLRPKVPAGATAVSYHRPILGLLITFIVLAAIEIPIVDLIVHPWPWVRIPLLVAGIWGVTWMLGLLLGYLTRPHAVGPEGIRLRQGTELEIRLTWDDVYSIERRNQIAEHGSPNLTPGRTGGAWVLHLRPQDETNLILELERPVEVRMPRGRVLVDEIRCWADDALAFLDAARPHLTAG